MKIVLYKNTDDEALVDYEQSSKPPKVSRLLAIVLFPLLVLASPVALLFDVISFLIGKDGEYWLFQRMMCYWSWLLDL